MRAWCRLLPFLTVCLAVACAPPSRDDGRGDDTTTTEPPAGCGNGQIDSGETCDPAISSGPGSCPASCDDGLKCTADAMAGSARLCSAVCNHSVVPGCSEDGGGPNCGNARLDPGEACDPGIASGPGSCPTGCTSDDPCAPYVVMGSVDLCTAHCMPSPVTSCRSGDGCCAPGCTSGTDNDCPSSATCGNGRLDQGEACDPGIFSGQGVCPLSCDDGNACTTDTLTGSASTCSTRCGHAFVTACRSNDGCCPSGCTSANDNDCGGGCVATSCGAQGISCGTASDGCGHTISCGGCSAGSTCQGGQCVQAQAPTVAGKACATTAECGSGFGCITEASSGWTGGYCSKQCTSDGDCGGGAKCALSSGSTSVCVKSCSSNSDCRWGYQCYDGTGDGVAECLPVGIGSTPVGGTCQNIAQCGGGTLGSCLTEQGSGFKGGYCSQQCSSSEPCPTGSHCLSNGYCAADCTGSCRSGIGYACFDADRNGANECWVSATGGGQVGAPCKGTWECAGGIYGICATAGDGFTDGMCLLYCGAGQATCPGGSSCNNFDPNTANQQFCLPTCPATTCRSGYTCSDATSDGTTDCWPQ